MTVDEAIAIVENDLRHCQSVQEEAWREVGSA
jgi:hypothetical protein